MINQRTRSTSIFALLALVIAASAANLGLAAPEQNRSNSIAAIDPSHYRSPSNTHKLLLPPGTAAARLAALHATTTLDYGSYQIAQVDTSALAALEGQAELRDDMNVILLNTGAIDTTTASAAIRHTSAGDFVGKRMRLVQFVGPIRPEWYQALIQTGVHVVGSIPQNAFLVYGDAAQLAQVATLNANAAIVQWDGPFGAPERLETGLANTTDQRVAIQLVRDPEANPATLALIETLRRDQPRITSFLGYLNIVVTLAPGSMGQIANQPDVVSIQAYDTPQRQDERQDQILAGNRTGNGPTTSDYLTWLANQGFTQAQFDSSGFVVDVSDSGIDSGTTSPNHFALYRTGIRPGTSRIAYNRIEGTPNTGSTLAGIDGHGGINGHIIGGYVPSGAPYNTFPHADGSGFRYGLGVAPFVRLGSSVIFDNGTPPVGSSDYTFPNFANMVSRAYRDGARVSSNSWGGSQSHGAYNLDAQTYDALVRDAQPSTAAVPAAGNQELVVVFAAGNDGNNGASSVDAPGTAKNVITVGASEGVQPFGAADGCNIADAGADNLNDVISFSSRGPTADLRRKPDLMAPGTHITGGAFQSSNPGANGTANPAFNGNGVCGGTAGPFSPNSQQWYTASSGTSHSTPAVAGAAALVRQFFINRGLTPPSPAMTKAYMTNGASYMTGVSANDTLFSNNQGMGLLTLAPLFDTSTKRILRDQGPANTFSASGSQLIVNGVVADSTKPLRISLAWTDAPGTTTGASYVNDLNLRVQVGDTIYLGNVFNGANSTTGGASDTRNNLESVFLPAGIAIGTPVTITIQAANITGDGVPNSGSTLDQDFALVASNVSSDAVPSSIVTLPLIVKP